MAYLRSKDELLTCFQDSAPYSDAYSPKADLVLVYGLDDTLPERLRAYKRAGYRCACMFALSWGNYADYLKGAFDGERHLDEVQRDREGRELIHNIDVPYLVPTDSFCDYLIDRLKKALDAGAEGAVIEEPELSASAGYSEAFRRAYENKYSRPFAPQHESTDAALDAARLKADIFKDAIGRIARGIKDYACQRGRTFQITVATHSVINYSGWQIVSPVAQAALMPEVDSVIAQVWTGTSRTAQVYAGEVGERIFESALMEYASLTASAGAKPVYLLNDPIEDSPTHSWEMYQKSYIDTLIACLMQPGAMRFELCPWPRRVFLGEYPRVQPHVSFANVHSDAESKAKPIPRDYASVLCGAFELLGNMPEEAGHFEGNDPLCFFLSDTCLHQRFTPDDLPCDREFESKCFRLLTDFLAEKPGSARECSRLIGEAFAGGGTEAQLNAFKESTLAPDFFGLAMPLIKGGLPLRFLFTGHVAAGLQSLDEVSAAVLSYDFMLPESPEVNEKIAAWVLGGGHLIYVGESNPFAAKKDAWWQKAGFSAPQAHLFALLQLPGRPADGEYRCGKGSLRRVCMSPAKICLSAESAGAWRKTVAEELAKAQRPVHWRNHFTFRRGDYLLCAAMKESVSAGQTRFPGLYADMLSPTFAVKKDPAISCGERALLYDLNAPKPAYTIIGTQGRVLSMEVSREEDGEKCRLRLVSLKHIHTHLRLICPKKPMKTAAFDADKRAIPLESEWDRESATLLLSYESDGGSVLIELLV